MAVKVLLLDDEELVRGGIRLILESDPDLRVVAEAPDGSDVLDLVERHRPDVVLTDVQMPGVDGLEVVRRVTALPDAPAVVVLTTFDLDEYVHSALRGGATGFLLKDTPPRDLVRAVHVVARGEAMISPGVTRRLLLEFAAEPDGRTEARRRLSGLTPREREVAEAVGRGASNAGIARELFLSESTVKVHIGRIMAKLDAANRTQVAITVHDASR
ncbi:response regulator transcription factor [Actinosynnema pretiosum subsp. pretiosum]|uniref:Two component transcriptional regulator, LuxR family n=2 Tax=Actinosynnema TaxID=40566 RepID=C6WFM3_ACTMD|nr:response regulator transcription factor [Actinosynnema mirum]ACU35958.1 two component transcriptional regulator, LuxR family [Actinosynnema mirum DSM 43827]AXX29380.1 DNA-binding response regulator, LuxR family [Actinosynnema pretiosum subsp. pretiosum]QUF06372.1 response regulator transcription factor [Actinosynnema pretiosum subsp. pretiosum]